MVERQPRSFRLPRCSTLVLVCVALASIIAESQPRCQAWITKLPLLGGRRMQWSQQRRLAMSPVDDDSTATTTTNQTLQMESVVRRYFQGVDEKNAAMIRSCFGETAVIRDVCALTASSNKNSSSSSSKKFPADAMVQRCMEFVTAHPDCCVQFHLPPTRLSSSSSEGDDYSDWVFAHWYETGTWTGISLGLTPTHEPMHVEGQTRFRVDSNTMTIQELVVTRTFTDWERTLLSRQDP